MKNDFPFITCYGRLLDTITKLPITDFEDALNENKIWELGTINKNYGGITECILELDIWNNEPDVSAGGTQLFFDDANNCTISVLPENNIPPKFLKINDINAYNNFIELSNPVNISGNYNSTNIGVLHGIGDHATIQFMIDIKKDKDVVLNAENIFLIILSYTSQSKNVQIAFKCKFTAISSMIEIDKSTVNTVNVIEGFINGSTTPIYVEAYNENNVLQDKCITINDKYKLLLNNGTYRFNIKNGSGSITQNNIVIDANPVTSYATIKKGLIYDINNDIIKYINDDGKAFIEAYGYIKNEYGNPIDAEIIILNEGNIVVYYKTDISGYYRFCLDTGTYDIKIRSKNRPIKIVNNFVFDGTSLLFNLNNIYANFNNKIDFSIN